MTPTRLVIHHSATADGRTLSTDDIRRYHLEHNGWRDIGYHVVIEQVEAAIVGVLGRPLCEPGAHAPGANHDSLGICLVGNFDLAPPSAPLLAAAARIVAGFAVAFDIPASRIVGHRDVTEGRTCPGRLFAVDAFRDRVHAAALSLIG